MLGRVTMGQVMLGQVMTGKGGGQSPLGNFPWGTVCLALPVLVAAWWPAAATALQLDRSAVASGEVWRIVTGHWTHWSADHLLWDLLAFLGLGALCELKSRKTFFGCLLVASVVIGLGVLGLEPELATYRGLSGLDSALYVLLAVTLLKEAKGEGFSLSRLVPALALVLFVAKVVFELASGGAVFVRAEGLDVVVVPLAHFLGGIVGCGAALGRWRGWYIADHVEAPGTDQTFSSGSALAEP